VIPGGGKDTHESVYLYLLKGLNDTSLVSLPWPVHLDVKVVLLNQIATSEHHAMTTEIVASRVILTKTLVGNIAPIKISLKLIMFILER